MVPENGKIQKLIDGFFAYTVAKTGEAIVEARTKIEDPNISFLSCQEQSIPETLQTFYTLETSWLPMGGIYLVDQLFSVEELFYHRQGKELFIHLHYPCAFPYFYKGIRNLEDQADYASRLAHHLQAFADQYKVSGGVNLHTGGPAAAFFAPMYGRSGSA